MLNKKYLVIIIMTLIVFTTIFSSNLVYADSLNVAVTIVPQKEFVKAVAGEDVNVTVMIPPGYSPGNYAPKPQELTGLTDSSIYFSMGVPADLQNILPKVKQFNPDIKVVKLFEKVNDKYPDRMFSKESRDPHIWLSLKRVEYMVEIIRDELIELRPENKEIYIENTENYIKKIRDTEQEINDILKNKKDNYLLVYHPSFGYLADEFALEMVSIEKEGKEATAKDLEDIIDFAKDNKITRIYHQAEIDSRQTESLAEEINAKLIQLNPLAENYLENMVEMVKKIAGDD
ncbi:MAG: zinc ABC transporter substrate-binding protein [Halanaerobiales bacterium]|nr:zinc ABC transporter substrate-binding protein [Halanaerobiales bacterium]